MSECVVKMRIPSKDKACGMVIDLCGVWFCPVKKRICLQPDNGEIPSWCPIICSLPEGHGRLVDADALLEQHKPSVFTKVTDFTEGQRSVVANIKNALTIVPAERKDNGKTC